MKKIFYTLFAWELDKKVKKDNSGYLAWNYLNLSFFITYILLLIHLSTLNTIGLSAITIYYILTLPIYYYLVLSVLFFAISFIVFNRYLTFLYVIIKTFFDFFLIINFFVFKNYKFHIDSLFIDMFIHDLGGLGISIFAYIVSVSIFIAIFALNLYLFRKAKNSKKSYKKITFLIISLFVINQLIHIWASYFNQEYITKYTPYFPYYLPTTSVSNMKKLSEKYPFIIPQHQGEDKKFAMNSNQKSIFNYPKKEITIDINNSTKLPNIIYIILESWQQKEFNSKTTPHIYNFAQQNWQYQNHFSSGNVTLTGLFGLMYGLYATDNLKYIQSNPLRYQSIFTKTLDRLGYDMSIYTSSNIERFSLKEMFFGKISDDKVMILTKDSNSQNDKKVVEEIVKSFSKPTSKPWFKFLFLTSSHHSYYYPKNFEKNLPITDNAEAFLLDSSIDPTPYKNRYRNSLLYEDFLIKKVLDRLKNQLDNTIVVITGDHAEEFNENRAGLWGHGSNFTNYQTQVPLIIHFPKKDSKIVRDRTSHVDIVPTLLKYIGVKNSVLDFSSGVDLNSIKEEKRDIIFASYKSKAYLIDDNILSVGLFTSKYKLYNYNDKNVSIDISNIKKLKIMEGSFFK